MKPIQKAALCNITKAEFGSVVMETAVQKNVILLPELAASTVERHWPSFNWCNH